MSGHEQPYDPYIPNGGNAGAGGAGGNSRTAALQAVSPWTHELESLKCDLYHYSTRESGRLNTMEVCAAVSILGTALGRLYGGVLSKMY